MSDLWNFWTNHLGQSWHKMTGVGHLSFLLGRNSISKQENNLEREKKSFLLFSVCLHISQHQKRREDFKALVRFDISGFIHVTGSGLPLIWSDKAKMCHLEGKRKIPEQIWKHFEDIEKTFGDSSTVVARCCDNWTCNDFICSLTMLNI